MRRGEPHEPNREDTMMTGSPVQAQRRLETLLPAVLLAAVRLAFRPLSDAVAKKALPDGYAVAYCPMAFNNEGGVLGPAAGRDRQSLLRGQDAAVRGLRGAAGGRRRIAPADPGRGCRRTLGPQEQRGG